MLNKLPAVIAGLALSISASVSVSAETPKDPPATDSGNKTGETQAKDGKWDSEKRHAALRIQLYLDNQGFGPGKIDGRWGGLSRKAAYDLLFGCWLGSHVRLRPIINTIAGIAECVW